jgi:hypothetical protein
MHKHINQAYKTVIKVEIKLLQLGFKDYKMEKQKVLQKIKYISGSIYLNDKGIHLALEVKPFLSNSTPVTGPNTKSSLQKLRSPIDSHHRHRQKREGERSPTHKGYKANLERLRSARLTRHDQTVTL